MKKTFGQVLTEARKRAGLTQKEVAERLRREDGRPVDAPYLNAVEHDRRRPPPNHLIEQLARIIGISAEVLFFHANRMPTEIEGDPDEEQVEAAYQAFRKALKDTKSGKQKG
jgi:transcriptional regulator with XRE-family HTH domain